MIAYEELLEKLRENADVSFGNLTQRSACFRLIARSACGFLRFGKYRKNTLRSAKMNWTFFVVSPTICLR